MQDDMLEEDEMIKLGLELLSGDINWNEMRSMDDISKIPKELVYDDSVDTPGSDYKIRPEITDEEEIEDALFWKDYARGIIIISGSPGQGKDMTAHMIAKKLNRYFGIKVITDTRPRSLFGECIPFSESFLVDQLDRMWEVATGVIPREQYINERTNRYKKLGYKPKEALEKAMLEEEKYTTKPHVTRDGRWISSRGEVFIRNAVWLLSEFGAKYMNINTPHAPITTTLLFKVFPIWRHLNCVIIGNTQEMKDINRRCEPKITAEIRCTRIPDPRGLLFQSNLRPLRYISSMGELEFAGKITPLKIDGNRIRDFLGKDLIYVGNDKKIVDACIHKMRVEKYGIPIVETNDKGSPTFRVWRAYGWKDIYNTKQAVAVQAPRSMRRNQ